MFDILPEEKKILVPAGVILMSNVQTCLIFPQARSSSENAHPLQRQNSPRAEADTDFFFSGWRGDIWRDWFGEKTNDCPIKKNWVQVLRKVEKSKQMSLPLEKQCQFFEKFFWTHYQTLDGTLASEDNYPFLLPQPFFFTICLIYCMPASYSFFICHP